MLFKGVETLGFVLIRSYQQALCHVSLMKNEQWDVSKYLICDFVSFLNCENVLPFCVHCALYIALRTVNQLLSDFCCIVSLRAVS